MSETRSLEQCKGSKDTYIVTYETGNSSDQPFFTALLRICQALGDRIERQRIPFHSLRVLVELGLCVARLHFAIYHGVGQCDVPL